MAITISPKDAPENSVTAHEGLVLEVFEKEERIMSDVWEMMSWVTVWDEESNAPKSDRRRNMGNHWSDSIRVTVDATPEIVAKFDAWKELRNAKSVLSGAHSDIAQANSRASADHHTPANGKTVVVTRSHKESRKGDIGIVFWHRGGRSGIRTSDRKNATGQWADVLWVNDTRLANAVEFMPTVDKWLMKRLQDAQARVAAAETAWAV